MATSLTTTADRIRTATFKRFLVGMYNQIIGHQFAQRKSIPAGKAGMVQFDKVIPLPVAATYVVSEGSDVSADSIYTTKVTGDPAKHGRAVTRNWEVYLSTEGFQDWKIMANEAGDQAAAYHDKLVMKLLAQNAYRIRADADATYSKDVTTTSDGAAGFTTFISTGITEATGFWDGAYATVKSLDTAYLSRKAFWETRQISGQVTTTCTVAAFSALIYTGCVIHLAVGTGITATDTLGLRQFGLAVRQLKRNRALRFDDSVLTEGTPKHREIQNIEPGAGGGKYWAMIYDEDLEFDWMQSEKYIDMAIYQDKAMLINGTPKKYMGTLIFGSSQCFREDVDGTENLTSGAVHPVQFLGQQAYGINCWAGRGMKPPYGVVLTLKEPTDFADYSRVKSSLAWQSFFVNVSLSSHSNVVILGGTTP